MKREFKVSQFLVFVVLFLVGGNILFAQIAERGKREFLVNLEEGKESRDIFLRQKDGSLIPVGMMTDAMYQKFLHDAEQKRNQPVFQKDLEPLPGEVFSNMEQGPLNVDITLGAKGEISRIDVADADKENQSELHFTVNLSLNELKKFLGSSQEPLASILEKVEKLKGVDQKGLGSEGPSLVLEPGDFPPEERGPRVEPPVVWVDEPVVPPEGPEGKMPPGFVPRLTPTLDPVPGPSGPPEYPRQPPPPDDPREPPPPDDPRWPPLDPPPIDPVPPGDPGDPEDPVPPGDPDDPYDPVPRPPWEPTTPWDPVPIPPYEEPEDPTPPKTTEGGGPFIQLGGTPPWWPKGTPIPHGGPVDEGTGEKREDTLDDGGGVTTEPTEPKTPTGGGTTVKKGPPGLEDLPEEDGTEVPDPDTLEGGTVTTGGTEDKTPDGGTVSTGGRTTDEVDAGGVRGMPEQKGTEPTHGDWDAPFVQEMNQLLQKRQEQQFKTAPSIPSEKFLINEQIPINKSTVPSLTDRLNQNGVLSIEVDPSGKFSLKTNIEQKREFIEGSASPNIAGIKNQTVSDLRGAGKVQPSSPTANAAKDVEGIRILSGILNIPLSLSGNGGNIQGKNGSVMGKEGSSEVTTRLQSKVADKLPASVNDETRNAVKTASSNESLIKALNDAATQVHRAGGTTDKGINFRTFFSTGGGAATRIGDSTDVKGTFTGGKVADTNVRSGNNVVDSGKDSTPTTKTSTK